MWCCLRTGLLACPGHPGHPVRDHLECCQCYRNAYDSGSFPGGSLVKNLPAKQEFQFQSLDWEEPLEEGVATHSIILPGESHGQRSLVGYSPWGHEESDAA